VATTDANDGPIFPKPGEACVDGPPVSGCRITYIAISGRLRPYLHPFSMPVPRRVVGLCDWPAIVRVLALAALRRRSRPGKPPAGYPSPDRCSQYLADDYALRSREHGLKGSMGRAAPLGNAKARAS